MEVVLTLVTDSVRMMEVGGNVGVGSISGGFRNHLYHLSLTLTFYIHQCIHNNIT